MYPPIRILPRGEGSEEVRVRGQVSMKANDLATAVLLLACCALPLLVLGGGGVVVGTILGNIAAIVVGLLLVGLAVLAVWVRRRRAGGTRGTNRGDEVSGHARKVRLTIRDMTCEHCVSRVEHTLERVRGVLGVKATLKEDNLGEAEILYNRREVSSDDLKRAVSAASGSSHQYTVISVIEDSQL